jgi:hypothetical protein
MKNNKALVVYEGKDERAGVDRDVLSDILAVLNKERINNNNSTSLNSVLNYNVDYFKKKSSTDVKDPQESAVAPLLNLNNFTTSDTTISSLEIQGNIEEENIVCTETRNTFQEQDINSLITEEIIKEAENERVNTIRELNTTDIASNLFNLNISSIGNGLIVLVGTGLLSYYFLTRSERSNNNTTIDGEDRTILQANFRINQPRVENNEGIAKKALNWLGKKLFKR